MRKTVAAIAAAVVALLGAVDIVGAPAAPASASASAVTDRTCPFTLAQARSYATRPSTVRSAKTASCVVKYVESINPTRGFAASATIAYSVVDDHEYGDAGGDGVYTKSAHGTYDASSSAAYELDETYDELADLSQQGSDDTTLRYLDQKAGVVYLARPQKLQDWTRSSSSKDASGFTLDSSALFARRGFTITSWTKAASSGRNTWTFTFGDRLDGGTARFVVASSGELLSGTSSLHYDGQNHTVVTAFTGSYTRIKNVSIPPGIVGAAK